MARENMLRQAIKDAGAKGQAKLDDTVKQAGVLGAANAAVAAAASAGAAAIKSATAAAAAIPCFRVHSQDLFDWSSPQADLLSSLALHAPLSYGSSRLTFSRSDVLDPSHPTTPWRNSHVVTLMFVLNELLQENKAAALAFLSRLVESLRPGALLIVADSAGTFSQVSLGKGEEEEDVAQRRGLVAGAGAGNGSTGTEATAAKPTEQQQLQTDDGSLSDNEGEGEEAAESAAAPPPAAGSGAAPSSSSSSSSSTSSKARRRYWVYQLLDLAPSLQALVSENSLWYRYPGEALGLKYPLKFENMRYFLRIYKKI
jgi:hypothetical protein